MPFVIETVPIIGMSPGNSYFKDDEIRTLLAETLKRYGCAVVFVADVPAIETYRALGYDAKKAREKAILKGNNLKNKVRKACVDLGIENDIVRIIDWQDEIADHPDYLASFGRIRTLFETNDAFRRSALDTTRTVLENADRNIPDLDLAAERWCFYLLSELAFLDFAAGFLGCRRVTYVYHRLWPVYEDYLAGRFDASSKPHLGFRLMEAPHEYFESVVFADALDRVHETKRLFAGFIEYRYALYREGAGYAGYFYELIREICHRSGWELVLTGKTGYSAAIAGLDAGKFDIYASPVWPTEERLRQALFSASVSRSEAYVYARPGIDASRLATDASLRMAVLDTDITDQLSRSDFPLAIKRRFSGLSRIEDLLYAVGRAEADFTVCEEMTYRSYRQEWGAELVRVSERPVRTYDNCFMLRKHETRLCAWIDDMIGVLSREGFVDGLMEKYLGPSEAVGR